MRHTTPPSRCGRDRLTSRAIRSNPTNAFAAHAGRQWAWRGGREMNSPASEHTHLQRLDGAQHALHGKCGESECARDEQHECPHAVHPVAHRRQRLEPDAPPTVGTEWGTRHLRKTGSCVAAGWRYMPLWVRKRPRPLSGFDKTTCMRATEVSSLERGSMLGWGLVGHLIPNLR